jgi:hypothetical protein
MAERPRTALQDNASFAAKFIGGTTNLAQRRRYQEDIQAALNEQFDMEEEQFSRANRAAELADPLKARAIRATEQRLEQGMEQFEGREERLTKDQILKQKALEERISAHDWKQTQDIMVAEDKKLLNQHTQGLMLEMADVLKKGIRQGTEAFANEAFERVKKYSKADPKMIQNIFKDARIDADVNDLLAEQAYLDEQGIKTRIRISKNAEGRLSGGLTQYIPPAAKPEKTVDPGVERQKMQTEYSRLEKLFNEADGKRNPEIKAFFGGELHALREKMKLGPNLSGTKVSAPAAATEEATSAGVAASASSTAATPKLYTLTPDKKIQFNSKNFLASVQQALDDNLIDDATAIKLLDGSPNIKKKGK